MSDKYILEGKRAVPVESALTWGKWFEKNRAQRQVCVDMLPDGVRVSTVFLGLDHSFGAGPPLLFETLVFEGPMDGEMDRYSTWDEAERGHAAMVERVRAALPKAV